MYFFLGLIKRFAIIRSWRRIDYYIHTCFVKGGYLCTPPFSPIFQMHGLIGKRVGVEQAVKTN